MDKRLQQFARRYISAAKQYLAKESEAGLEAAYRLGRRAIAAQLGVLDMARLHKSFLEESLQNSRKHRKTLRATEDFFLEALSPFEVTHRGFRETNIRLAQLIKTLEKRNRDLAALSNQVLHVQEDERKRISRELHDEVGQALAAISVALAGMKSEDGSQNFKKKLSATQSLLSETMVRVHDFALELRPPMLDELGLLPALRSMIKFFAARTGIQTRFYGNPAVEKLTAAQKTVLFRVAQECLTNVASQANARNVEIAICKSPKGICMIVTDDGRSFPPGSEESESVDRRLGFLGMEERIRLINGQFKVLPKLGKGTTIRVTIHPT